MTRTNENDEPKPPSRHSVVVTPRPITGAYVKTTSENASNVTAPIYPQYNQPVTHQPTFERLPPLPASLGASGTGGRVILMASQINPWELHQQFEENKALRRVALALASVSFLVCAWPCAMPALIFACRGQGIGTVRGYKIAIALSITGIIIGSAAVVVIVLQFFFNYDLFT